VSAVQEVLRLVRSEDSTDGELPAVLNSVRASASHHLQLVMLRLDPAGYQTPLLV
jgi:hypothetical protein